MPREFIVLKFEIVIYLRLKAKQFIVQWLVREIIIRWIKSFWNRAIWLAETRDVSYYSLIIWSNKILNFVVIKSDKKDYYGLISQQNVI